jgi:hypothetical protein
MEGNYFGYAKIVPHLDVLQKSPIMCSEHSNPKCYARTLGDCSEKISKEHYISHSLLKILAGSDTLDVSGFPWLNGSSIKTSPSGLTASFLCKKHNEQLSSLDGEALKFFNHLRYKVPQKNEAFEIDGGLLEKWCLKLLVGIVILQHGKENIPDRKWLEVLYRNRELSNGEGLYIPRNGGSRGVYNEVQIELKINEIKKSVLGVFIQSGWFRCYFCVDPSEFPQGDFVYRPSFVGIQYPDQRRGVGLGWSGTGVVFKGPIPEYL